MIVTQNADFTMFCYGFNVENRGTVSAMRRPKGIELTLRTALLGALWLPLAACSSALPDVSQFRAPSMDLSSFQVRDWNAFAKSQTGVRSVSADDLVDGSGRCAGMAPPVMGDAGGDASAAPAIAPVASTRGVGLDMTECEVVSAAGPPQQVDIGANERGERNVIMTYTSAERSGTYRFVGGRLTSLERGPEPPPTKQAEKKPAKKQAKPKQPPRQSPST